MKALGTTIKLTGTARRFSPGSGWSTVLTYEGTHAEIVALERSLYSLADETNLSPSEGPLSQLAVTYGYDETEVPEQLWEFPSEMGQEDILTHPRLMGVSDTVMEALKAFKDGDYGREDNDAGEDVGFTTRLGEVWRYDANGDIESVFDGAGVNAVALEFIRLMARGIETTDVPGTIVRVTTTVSGHYSIQISRALAGKLITTATLTALLSPPGDVRFTLPTEADEDTPPAGWSWKWFCYSPDVSMAGDGKWKIVQEFRWTLASDTQYATATP